MFDKVHNYVVFIKTEEELQTIIRLFPCSLTWNPHANFIIYIEEFLNDVHMFAEKIIRAFWKLWVINITIMGPNKNFVDVVID